VITPAYCPPTRLAGPRASSKCMGKIKIFVRGRNSESNPIAHRELRAFAKSTFPVAVGSAVRYSSRRD
jgi:hypothetical protein